MDRGTLPNNDFVTHHPITRRADPLQVVIKPFVPAEHLPATSSRIGRAQRIVAL